MSVIKEFCFVDKMSDWEGESMKKSYEKPALICEELRAEELLCGCQVMTPQFNEVQMCTFPYKPNKYATITYNLFASNWDNCDPVSHVYCYHMGQLNLFSS